LERIECVRIDLENEKMVYGKNSSKFPFKEIISKNGIENGKFRIERISVFPHIKRYLIYLSSEGVSDQLNVIEHFLENFFLKILKKNFSRNFFNFFCKKTAWNASTLSPSIFLLLRFGRF